MKGRKKERESQEGRKLFKSAPSREMLFKAICMQCFFTHCDPFEEADKQGRTVVLCHIATTTLPTCVWPIRRH